MRTGSIRRVGPNRDAPDLSAVEARESLLPQSNGLFNTSLLSDEGRMREESWTVKVFHE